MADDNFEMAFIRSAICRAPGHSQIQPLTAKMKKQLLLSAFSVLAIAASVQAATVVADRVVVTNSVINAGTGVATHWAEVQVFQQGSATNAAAASNGGTATASSTGWGTTPSWAIDGNTDGAFGANTSWHDNDGQGGGPEPDVFTVNFSAPVSVDSFNIWGRSDCCPERDNTFLVEFYNGANLVGSNDASIGDTFNTGVSPINAIPEPAAMSAGLLALAALGLRRRRA